jgi:hypothetical protein
MSLFDAKSPAIWRLSALLLARCAFSTITPLLGLSGTKTVTPVRLAMFWTIHSVLSLAISDLAFQRRNSFTAALNKPYKGSGGEGRIKSWSKTGIVHGPPSTELILNEATHTFGLLAPNDIRR